MCSFSPQILFASAILRALRVSALSVLSLPGRFIRRLVSRRPLRLQRTNLETQAVLNAGILRGETGGFAKTARHDQPVAADDFFASTERPVLDARLRNHRALAAEPAAHFHFAF